jgi:hypothetical protein
MTAYDLYRSPARLPARRARLDDLDVDHLVAQGWAEYLQGHTDRATAAMRAATQRAPDRPYSRLNAYLLDDLLRGRRARPRALRAFARRSLAGKDREAWLLASAHALRAARAAGRPGHQLLKSWDRLVELAHEVEARLAPELALRATRTAFGLGLLQEAEARARALARSRPRGCEAGARARLVVRAAQARRTGAHPVLPVGLEGLHPLHQLEALLTVGDCARRGGDPEAAEDYLTRAARIAHARGVSAASVAVLQRRAALALDERRPARAAALLEEARPTDNLSRTHQGLLQARLAAARGDPTGAARRLEGCREALESQGWCGPVQDLALLEAELDPTRPRRHWRRVRTWEDTDVRVSMLAILLPRVRDRATFRELWRGRPEDPRLRCIRDRLRGHFDRPVPRDVPGQHIRRSRAPDSAWDLLLDTRRRRATAGETELDLRRSERTLRLLEALLHQREGLTVEELTTQVWDRSRIAYETDQLVHSAVYRLRGRLPDPDLIEFTGERYRLAPDARVALRDS